MYSSRNIIVCLCVYEDLILGRSHWSLLIFCNLGENVHSKTNTPCMLLVDSMHVIGPTRLEPLIRR